MFVKKETLRSVPTSFGQKLIVKKISKSSNTNFNIFVKEFVKLKGDLHCLKLPTNFHDFFVFCHLIDFFPNSCLEITKDQKLLQIQSFFGGQNTKLQIQGLNKPNTNKITNCVDVVIFKKIKNSLGTTEVN